MDKLFDTKRTYKAIDGEEYVDMCIPVVDFDKIKGCTVSKVTQDDNGRIDKIIWREVAKNMNMIDTVMYANHIFNPFALKEGDILYCPNDNDDIYVKSGEPSLPDGSKHSNNMSGEKEKTKIQQLKELAKSLK